MEGRGNLTSEVAEFLRNLVAGFNASNEYRFTIPNEFVNGNYSLRDIPIEDNKNYKIINEMR